MSIRSSVIRWHQSTRISRYKICAPSSSRWLATFDTERLIARLSTLFGIIALTLACVGLYGVMSYFVARRTSEIGIRMALGATRGSVVTLVLRGAMWQILIGLVLGIPASLYVGYMMKSILYGVGAYDPLGGFKNACARHADYLRHLRGIPSRPPCFKH